MSIFPLEYLRHIMDEIEYLIDRSANLSEEDFSVMCILKEECILNLFSSFSEARKTKGRGSRNIIPAGPIKNWDILALLNIDINKLLNSGFFP